MRLDDRGFALGLHPGAEQERAAPLFPPRVAAGALGEALVGQARWPSARHRAVKIGDAFAELHVAGARKIGRQPCGHHGAWTDDLPLGPPSPARDNTEKVSDR